MNLYDKHGPKEFARDALFVQDACNLRAIARLLVAAADYAADNLGGTDASYTFAPVVLIANKIESLVHSDARFNAAYAECKRLSD